MKCKKIKIFGVSQNFLVHPKYNFYIIHYISINTMYSSITWISNENVNFINPKDIPKELEIEDEEIRHDLERYLHFYYFNQ